MLGGQAKGSAMVWDLRGALLKKGEVETARLADFEFRLRVRTARLLAADLGLDADHWGAAAAARAEDALRAALAEAGGLSPDELARRWREAEAAARRALIAEIGDPAPHRLA